MLIPACLAALVATDIGTTVVAVTASIIASLIIAITSLWIVGKTQRAENQRVTRNDLAHLRDLKGERLRELYAPLVDYAFVLGRIATEKGGPPFKETREVMNQRHETEMADGRRKVQEVRARLLLEAGTDGVWKAYEEAVRAWWTVHESVRLVMEEGHNIDQQAFNEILGKAQSAADGLRTAALAQLTEHERPIAEEAKST